MSKVHLITGYKGEEHIQSADQGSFNASFFGGGEYVMEAGNQFEGSIMDNNTVRILDGDLLMQGRHIRIEPETYEDITITTGTAGVNRIDLIVMQYSKDTSTDIESAGLVVVKGTETEGTATEPEYTSGNILSGATLNQMPLYRVKVEGVVLTEIEPLFTVIPTYKTLAEQYAAQFEATITALKAANILDTMEEVEANTQENMIAGALALKELKNTSLQKSGGQINGNITGTENDFRIAATGDIKSDRWGGWLSNALANKVTNDFTGGKAIVSHADGYVATSITTSTEISYLSGAKSNIQAQFDNVGTTLQSGTPTQGASVANGGDILSLTIPTGGKWIITGYAGGHKVVLKTDGGAIYKNGINPLVYMGNSGGVIKMANNTGSAITLYADSTQYYINAIRIG